MLHSFTVCSTDYLHAKRTSNTPNLQLKRYLCKRRCSMAKRFFNAVVFDKEARNLVADSAMPREFALRKSSLAANSNRERERQERELRWGVKTNFSAFCRTRLVERRVIERARWMGNPQQSHKEQISSSTRVIFVCVYGNQYPDKNRSSPNSYRGVDRCGHSCVGPTALFGCVTHSVWHIRRSNPSAPGRL